MIARKTKRRRITNSYYNYYLKKYKKYINSLIISVLNGCDYNLHNFSYIGDRQLLRSMIYYSKNHGSRLKTYLTHRVRGCTMAAINKEKTYNRRKNIYGQKKGNNDRCVYNNWTYILLEELFEHLDSKEKTVLTMMVVENKLANEISQELSIPRTTVYYIEKKAIKKLREKFNEQEKKRRSPKEKRSKASCQI